MIRLNQMLDWIFPPRCTLCGQIMDGPGEEGLCGLCRFEDYQNPEAAGEWGRCSFLYEDELQRAIQRMKYEGRRGYSRYFARWMVAEGGSWAAAQHFDRVTAVPLSKKRYQSRGYNQAELLAREVGRLCRVPYEELLERTRDTRPQSGLGQALRHQNLEEAFRVKEGAAKPLHVCLIDDIYTTGSTVEACRRAILEKWPEAKVSYWVLAGRISPKFL